jgi:hypothetical protein
MHSAPAAKASAARDATAGELAGACGLEGPAVGEGAGARKSTPWAFGLMNRFREA